MRIPDFTLIASAPDLLFTLASANSILPGTRPATLEMILDFFLFFTPHTSMFCIRLSAHNIYSSLLGLCLDQDPCFPPGPLPWPLHSFLDSPLTSHLAAERALVMGVRPWPPAQSPLRSHLDQSTGPLTWPWSSSVLLCCCTPPPPPATLGPLPIPAGPRPSSKHASQISE